MAIALRLGVVPCDDGECVVDCVKGAVDVGLGMSGGEIPAPGRDRANAVRKQDLRKRRVARKVRVEMVAVVPDPLAPEPSEKHRARSLRDDGFAVAMTE